jgi:hypothetical protein
MLLTDDEILSASQDHFAKIANVRGDDVDWDKWANEFARAVEAAILAKLASAELPEPAGAYEEVVGVEQFQGFPSEIIEMRDAYSADQLRQAFAQGAASQLQALQAENERLKATIERNTEHYCAVVANKSALQAERDALAAKLVPLPEIDYELLIESCFRQTKYQQGTKGCVAFAKGAEWYRSIAIDAAKGGQHEDA